METFTITTAAGKEYSVSSEVAERVLNSSNEDMVEIQQGTLIKVSSVMEVTPNKEHRDYHQPYTQLPGKGIDGIIKSTNKANHIESMATGLKRFIDRQKAKGLNPLKAEAVLDLMRVRYAKLKTK